MASKEFLRATNELKQGIEASSAEEQEALSTEFKNFWTSKLRLKTYGDYASSSKLLAWLEEKKLDTCRKIINLTPEQWDEVNFTQRMQKRISQPTKIASKPYLQTLTQLLHSSDPFDVALGLLGFTGRRPSEIFVTGDFEKVDDYELLFSGQCKKRGAGQPFTIKVLAEADLLLEAFSRFNTDEKIRSIRSDLASLPTLEERNKEFNNRFATRLNEHIRARLSDVLPARSGDEGAIKVKNLRALYSILVADVFARDLQPIDQKKFRAVMLGHISDEEADTMSDREFVVKTAEQESYADYELADSCELVKAQKTTPTDEVKTLTIPETLYKKLMAFGNSQGLKNEVEVITVLLEDSEKLLEKIKNVAELETKLETALSTIENLETTVQRLEKVETKQPVQHTKKPVAEKKGVTTPPTNKELWASKGKGLPELKLQKIWDAIVIWNNANSEKPLLPTYSLLQKISGCNGLLVGSWLEERDADVITIMKSHNLKKKANKHLGDLQMEQAFRGVKKLLDLE